MPLAQAAVLVMTGPRAPVAMEVKQLAALAMTLGCAAIFLGVKAIEYTHKWELGLLPAGTYESQFLPSLAHHGVSDWLYYLSAVPALCVVGFGIWWAVAHCP